MHPKQVSIVSGAVPMGVLGFIEPLQPGDSHFRRFFYYLDVDPVYE